MREREDRPGPSKEEGPTCPPSDFARHLAVQGLPLYRGEGALEKSLKCSETGEQQYLFAHVPGLVLGAAGRVWSIISHVQLFHLISCVV